ncbi:MAG: phosphate ABC transporter permease subunit PstC [Acidimicrobiales bacterium]|nr:phosphate ABC transporter permease subunit PstC [Acidimicrobiales bacterium]
MSVPTLQARAWIGAVEVLLFLVLALAFALAEYFLSGLFTDFGPSNFWLAFVVLAAWNAWHFAGSQTALGAVVGHTVLTLDGRPASVLTIAVRQLIRFGVLYGIPVLAIDFDLRVGLLIWAVVGVVARYTPGHRAPWDLAAGTILATDFGSPKGLASLPLVQQPSDLRLDPRRARLDRRASRLMFLAGLTSVVISALIVWNIFTEAWTFVADDEFSWGILTDRGWFPRDGEFDLSTLFVGTLWITGIAMLVAGPVGLGVAFYLSEYASPRVRGVVKPLIETLASVPSVVLGLFAISFIAPEILQRIFDDIGIFSLLAAGIGVGILTVPIVASISEDAMRAVPMELREASYGLGGRKATTALRVVFPAALSGISAAAIVGISRAIGETMVVFIAAGGNGVFNTDPVDQGQTITAAMASLGAGTDQVAGSGLAFQSLYFLGALLFIMTMLLNVISDVIVRRFRQAY